MNRHAIATVTAVFVVLLLSSSLIASDMSLVRQPSPMTSTRSAEGSLAAGGMATYDGTIRIYMVQPESRWSDNNGYNYTNGFLGFAIVAPISIPDGTVWSRSVEWDAWAAGHGNAITEDNIGAVAVVFNSAGVTTDAYPNNGYWFTAHYADAAAMAIPGVAGENETASGFTHTVFLEEGTATW